MERLSLEINRSEALKIAPLDGSMLLHCQPLHHGCKIV